MSYETGTLYIELGPNEESQNINSSLKYQVGSSIGRDYLLLFIDDTSTYTGGQIEIVYTVSDLTGGVTNTITCTDDNPITNAQGAHIIMTHGQVETRIKTVGGSGTLKAIITSGATTK